MKAIQLILITSLLVAVSAGLATNVSAQLDPDPEAEGTTLLAEPIELTTGSSVSTISTNTSKPAIPAATSTTTTTTNTTTTNTTNTAAATNTTKRVNHSDCQSPCWCTQKVVDCEGKQLTQLPKFDQKSQYVEFRFANNSIEFVDFKALPTGVVQLIDLSGNQIKGFVEPTRKKTELPSLRVLNLAGNSIVSVANLTLWRMPALEELNLAGNKIAKLTSNDFSSTRQPNITKLHLQNQSNFGSVKYVLQRPWLKSGDWNYYWLKSIEEATFAPLTRLQHLNLSSSLQFNYHLPDQLFVKNQELDTIDLSYDRLTDVPVALRSASNLKKLILNGNMMTSFRLSDFLNIKKLEHLEVSHCPRLMRVEPFTFGEMNKLQRLIISDNPSFFDFAPEAFLNVTIPLDYPLIPSPPQPWSLSPATGVLALLDLSGNNMTTMSNPMDSKWKQQVYLSAFKQIDQLRLANNPWDCSCALEWIVKSTNLSTQQPIHCKTPHKYTDLEISQYFQLVDCQLEDSSLQKFVMILFLLFLIVLTLAVFIQKTDICRRLQWRDQYGTIYYTKASFPTEQV